MMMADRTMIFGVISVTVIIFLFAHDVDARRRNGMCNWMYHQNSTCPLSNFLCSNQRCITRELYCDGADDCGDKSDEYQCTNYNYCNNYKKKRCPGAYKCIPHYWFCDGVPDCPNGEDETRCDISDNSEFFGKEIIASLKSLRWLFNQSKPESPTEIWGSLVDKSAIALYFAGADFAVFNGTRKEIAYELSIQLLSRLANTKLQDVPSTEIASFINAFLVSCLDPRRFHGLDLVQELRTRVEQQNYTNPYVLLSLCNAGETITELDKMKLMDTFWSKHRTFWTDMQAVAVLALACASKQPGSDIDQETLRELTTELKQHQYRNGSVENLQTTALVMQALFSSEPDEDPDNFDEGRALEQILSSQKPDGSFGNLMNTYFVLPVLRCRSLVNISSDHCQSVRRDEFSALVNLEKLSGQKKRVEYSIWIGNEKDLERNLVLRVPQNMSFYGIMEIAAEIDSRFSFDYVVKNRKPYVNTISELQDNPEKGKFWFLYTVKDGKAAPSQESPADVIPKDNDHFVMWYRSGSWVV